MLIVETMAKQHDMNEWRCQEHVIGRITTSETPACHHFLVGTEDAEDRAEREHALGCITHVLDPAVNPADYYGWDIDGQDVVVHCPKEISSRYLHQISDVLLNEGARIIVISDYSGNYRFLRIPRQEGSTNANADNAEIHNRIHAYN